MRCAWVVVLPESMRVLSHSGFFESVAVCISLHF